MKNRYHQNRELLSAFLDGVLPEGRKQKVKKHLDSCAECREILRGLEAVRQLLSEYPLKDPGIGFQTAIFNRIEKERKPLALRAWSRRVSFSLGGVALILLIFILLYKPYFPSPVIEPEKVMTQPQAGKINKVEEKKVPAPAAKPAINQKRLAGVTDGVERGKSTELPAMEKGELKGIGGDLTLQAKPVSTPNAPETAAESKVTAEPVIVAAVSPQNAIIHTDEEWTRLWSVQNTVQNLSLPLPQIDFKNQMVIAVPTRQDHHEYQIVKTEDKTDKIVVQYREIVVGKDEKKTPPPYLLEIVNNRPSVKFQKVD